MDIDGDGLHEILRGVAGGDTELLDRNGRKIFHMGGKVAMNTKILDFPGEQVMVYAPEGKVSIYRDVNARDCQRAKQRYASPYYIRNQYARNIENNLCMHGGI